MAKDIKSKKFTGVYYRNLEDGSKTYRINYKDPIEKKTKWFTVGNSKDGFNEAFANNIRSEIKAKALYGETPNIPILKAKQNKTNINDLAKVYFDNLFSNGETKGRKTSKGNYNNHIKPFCGDMPFSQLSKDIAKKLQKRLLDKEYAPKTVNGIIELLMTIINFNIKNDYIKEANPLQGFKKLTINNRRERFLSEEEIGQLLKETSADKVLHLFTLLALSTGARLNAILAIQKRDINYSENSIKLNDFKSGGTYKGFIKPNLKEILKESTNGLNNGDYIISYSEGSRTEDKRIRRRLQPILDRLFNQEIDKNDRVNRVVIHTLRHTFASHLAINDTSIYKIMNLMNHKDINMTIHYAKLAPNSGLSDIDKLPF